MLFYSHTAKKKVENILIFPHTQSHTQTLEVLETLRSRTNSQVYLTH